jgi:hypothetical protein
VHADEFDTVAPAFTIPTRRGMLGLTLGSVLAFLGRDEAEVKRKKRKKKKKIRRNSFGCVDVGKLCTNSGQCCSGRCQGKEGKRNCVAHHSGGCTPADASCTGEPGVPCSAGGICLLTTGNAGFCAVAAGAACAACRQDADCEAGFGAGAACVICPVSDCEATDFRLCAAPAA